MNTRRQSGEHPIFDPSRNTDELSAAIEEKTAPDHPTTIGGEKHYNEAAEIEKAYGDVLENGIFRKARTEVFQDIAINSPGMEIDNREIDQMAREKMKNDYDRLKKDTEQDSGPLLRTIAEMHVYTAHLERSAELNPLTEIANKKRAGKVYEEAQKHPDFLSGKSVIVIVRMDADGFKEVNDTYGHKEGDTILKKIADQLQGELSKLRPTDLAVHISGDEFGLILLVNKPTNKKITLESIVEKVIERVVLGIEKIHLPNNKPISASAGFKIVDQENQIDFPTGDHLADKAASLSKQCKFISNFQQGSSRVVNADLSKADFLVKKGIDISNFEESSLKGMTDRMISQIFPSGVPARAEVVIEMLLQIAKEEALKRRTGPIN